MSYNQEEVARLEPRIRELFRISSELGKTFPGRKFTLDGHLVGSIGEVLAAFHYGLDLMPSSWERHDAKVPDGRLIQIKATQGNGHVALRSEPDYLIVLKIDGNTGEISEVYNGPGAQVWAACGKKSSNGTRPITLNRLKALAAQVPEVEKIAPVYPIMGT